MAITAEAPRYVRLAAATKHAHRLGTSGKLNGHSQEKIDCAGAFFGNALYDAKLAGQKRENGGIHPLLELGNIFFEEAISERRNPITEPHLAGMMQKALRAYNVLVEVSPCAAAYGNRGLAKEFLEDYDGALADFAKAKLFAGDESTKKALDNNASITRKAKERHEAWERRKAEEIPERI